MILPVYLLNGFLKLEDRTNLEYLRTLDLTKLTLADQNGEPFDVFPEFDFNEYVKSCIDLGLASKKDRVVIDYYYAYMYSVEGKLDYVNSFKKVFAYYLIDIASILLNTFPVINYPKDTGYLSCKNYCKFNILEYSSTLSEEDKELFKLDFSEVNTITEDLKVFLKDEVKFGEDNTIELSDEIEGKLPYLTLTKDLDLCSFYSLASGRVEVSEALYMKNRGLEILEEIAYD